MAEAASRGHQGSTEFEADMSSLGSWLYLVVGVGALLWIESRVANLESKMGTDDRTRCLGNMGVFEVWLRDCKVRMGADEHNHVHVERAREGGVDNGFRGVLVFVAGCVWGSALCFFFFSLAFFFFFFFFFLVLPCQLNAFTPLR